jgi:integrase
LEVAQESPYYVLFFTALSTGMRLGELLGLRWRDVDFDSGSLSVVQALYKRCDVCEMREPKSSHSRRQIAMPLSLTEILEQHKTMQEAQRILLRKPLTRDDLVFAYPDGKPLDPGVVSHSFSKALKKAGLPHIRFHDLRHSHATLLLKANVHPKIVSERLGHANIGITLDTYSHVLPNLQEKAAKVFDEILEQKQIAENVCKMFASHN